METEDIILWSHALEFYLQQNWLVDSSRMLHHVVSNIALKAFKLWIEVIAMRLPISIDFSLADLGVPRLAMFRKTPVLE